MRGVLSAVLLAALVASLPLRAEPSVVIALDPSKPGPKIDRHIFGQFAEHLGAGIYGGIWVGPDSNIPNTRGIRNDVVAALKALHVPVVRWPGGCFADEYHWRNGIGPANARRATLNPNWGGVIESNAFGTHEFMDFADQIGADAYVSINVGSGTVQEAADWMEYMTTDQPSALGKERAANGHPAPYKVPYLGIGNESWGCGGLMTPADYTGKLKIFGHFVHNFNTKMPTAQIAVGPNDGKTEYTQAVMSTWKENRGWAFDLGGLSMHSYTIGGWPPHWKGTGFGEDDYATVLQETLKMEPYIRSHSAIMDKYDPDKKVSLVVDEWGSWLAATPGSNPAFLVQENSMRDAIVAALNINIFARHADRVRMANIAQMINVLQAMILTDREKMLLTPTYHVFKMYVPFQDATLVPISFDAGRYQHGDLSLPRIDAIAAQSQDGTIAVAVVNVDPSNPAGVTLDVPGSSARRAVGQTLTAARSDAVNTFAAPNTVAPKPVEARVKGGKLTLTLAPQSITVLVLAR
jgi:alpha-L-arabinofuranosidase